MSVLPHHCAKCPSRWNGLNTAHCSSCHLTFTGVTAFDKHRTGSPANRICLPPEKVGLVLSDRSYPCYGAPGPETDFWEQPDDE